MNGSDELILITKKSGEFHYYIDVLQVTHHLYAGALAKEGKEKPPLSPLAMEITAYPNPFNASCDIEFSLPCSAPVSLEIYDTRGCKVYEEYLGELGTGQHRYVWDGENKNGMPLASGLYFVKIGNETQSKTQKVLLLK